MPDPEKPAVFSMLNSADAIYSMRRRLKFVLLWSIFASFWIISISVFFVLFAFGPKQFQDIELVIMVALVITLGIALFFAAIFVLPYSWKGAKKIEDFMAEFHPIWIKMQIEIESILGTETEETVSKFIKRVAPIYKPIKQTSRLYSKMSVKLNDINLFYRKGKRIGIVQIIQKDEDLNKDSLINLEKKAKRAIKSIRKKIGLFIVVHNNFTIDFSNWEDEDKLIGNGAFVLFLSETDTGLTVNWVSPITKRPLIH